VLLAVCVVAAPYSPGITWGIYLFVDLACERQKALRYGEAYGSDLYGKLVTGVRNHQILPEIRCVV